MHFEIILFIVLYVNNFKIYENVYPNVGKLIATNRNLCDTSLPMDELSDLFV